MMVDVETEVIVAPGDIIKERRAAEGSDCGHMCSNGAVFHYLSIHLETFAFFFNYICSSLFNQPTLTVPQPDTPSERI